MQLSHDYVKATNVGCSIIADELSQWTERAHNSSGACNSHIRNHFAVLAQSVEQEPEELCVPRPNRGDSTMHV